MKIRLMHAVGVAYFMFLLDFLDISLCGCKKNFLSRVRQLELPLKFVLFVDESIDLYLLRFDLYSMRSFNFIE